ncbi:acyl-CoA desaturase [Pyxidicoccus xibeiensis]|uniref:acyl-CoA desaturase n=1 Tax=Pyxidicoccus xibeiensis TaxID=2906759 RepID=UPI0020A715CB|nr:acyl-CoA desaturase [Pyxidicoccus xibeiensis]MCP3138581.1 acyl-CoA desaturase [Pyxidicoccus xibeiensis]
MSGGSKARLQRRYAALTVGVPTVGAGIAMWQLLHYGIGWLEVSLLVGMYIPTALGIEAGFHRFFAHRSFRAGRLVTGALAIFGSMAAQGPILFWAAIHRKHHAFTDKDGDPHSPVPLAATPTLADRLRAFVHAHVGWLFKVDDTDWLRYTADLLRDSFIFRLNYLYPLWVLLGLLIPAGIAGLVTESWDGAWRGMVWGGLLRIFLLDNVTWGVNSLGHLFGPRMHASGDQSRNMAWLALPSAGGSWHNNHHAFPGSARNDHHFWQFDLSGAFIEGLALAGLVSEVHRAGPIVARRKNRQSVLQ